MALAAGPGLRRGPRSVRTDLIARGLVGGAAVAAIVFSIIAVVQATQKVDVAIDYPEGSPQDFAQDWFETHDRARLQTSCQVGEVPIVLQKSARTVHCATIESLSPRD